MYRQRLTVAGMAAAIVLPFSACGDGGKSRPYVVISDNTMGSGRLADPEDGFALVTALLNDQSTPRALISTFGNTDETTAYDSILKVREWTGRSMPVLRGASVPENRTAEKQIEAVDYLIREAQGNSGRLDLVSIGSLTTLAAALRRESAFENNIGEVVIMGGAVHVPGNVPLDFKAEFNLAFDPSSAQEVFERLHDHITLVPLDATNGVVFDEEDMARLEAGREPLHFFIHDSISRWYDLNRVLFGGFYLFDAAALVAYLNPGVIAKDETVGMTIDPAGTTVPVGNGFPVRVLLELDQEAVKEYIFRALGL